MERGPALFEETMNLNSAGPICLRCSANRTKLRKRDLKRPFNLINCDVGQKSVMRVIRGIILNYLACETEQSGTLEPIDAHATFKRVCLDFFQKKVVGANVPIASLDSAKVVLIVRTFMDCHDNEAITSTVKLLFRMNGGTRGKRRRRDIHTTQDKSKCPFTYFTMSQLTGGVAPEYKTDFVKFLRSV